METSKKRCFTSFSLKALIIVVAVRKSALTMPIVEPNGLDASSGIEVFSVILLAAFMI